MSTEDSKEASAKKLRHEERHQELEDWRKWLVERKEALKSGSRNLVSEYGTGIGQDWEDLLIDHALNEEIDPSAATDKAKTSTNKAAHRDEEQIVSGVDLLPLADGSVASGGNGIAADDNVASGGDVSLKKQSLMLARAFSTQLEQGIPASSLRDSMEQYL